MTHNINRTKIRTIALAISLLPVFTLPAMAASTVEERLNELQHRLDDMQKLHEEVNSLKAQLNEERKDRQNSQDAMADKVLNNVKQANTESAKVDSATTIGGYGEITYSNFKNDTEHPATADLRRFVISVNHRFNDKISLHSELEIEHGVTSATDEGEVALEQAYLDYTFNDATNLKAGLFLIPLGLLNENHEPPVFYGVNRNEIETRIIPTTWREGGIGFFGRTDNGFGYDIGVTTGFDAGKIDEPAFGVRSGHQELSVAQAADLSVYGSIKYSGQPGLLLGAGVFTGSTGQNGSSNIALRNVNARLTLAEVHARYAAHGFDLQALYAGGRLGDSARVTNAIGLAAPKSLKGGYIQAAYHAWSSGEMDFAPFIRFEKFDINQQEDAANGILEDSTGHDRITTIGFNFKPANDVVLKADYQHYQKDRGNSSINLGLGYMF